MTRVAKFEGRWLRTWRWVHGLGRKLQVRPEKLLRLSETLSLGERRFLAVVEFQQQKFLIGGTASSVSLLAELGMERGSHMLPHAPRKTELPVEGLWP